MRPNASRRRGSRAPSAAMTGRSCALQGFGRMTSRRYLCLMITMSRGCGVLHGCSYVATRAVARQHNPAAESAKPGHGGID
jgi:hypothetical protein